MATETRGKTLIKIQDILDSLRKYANEPDDLIERAAERIDRIKRNMLVDESTTFFSFLLSMQRIYISREIPTAMTNGRVQVYNPDFVDSLDSSELLFLMLHEVMHPVFEHLDTDLWVGYDLPRLNRAGDHVINLYLKSLGYKMPEGGLADPRFTNMTTRQIYDILEQEEADDPPSPDAIGQDLDPSGMPGVSPEALREEILSNTIQAVQQADIAEASGSVPAAIRRKVDELTNPKVPWEILLANFIDSRSKDDYTRRKPNRRYWPDLYMPTQESDAIQGIVVAIDTSGSMSSDQIKQAVSEVAYLHNVVKPEYTRVIAFDADDHEDFTFEREDYMSVPDVDLSGGGGTRFEPVVELLKESQPEVVVVLSDGYFHVPNLDELRCEFLWIIDGKDTFNAPGRVIHW